MSFLAEIARAKEELKSWTMRALAQTFIYTLTAASSALGDKDAVESSDEGRDPGSPATEKKSQRSVVRIQPFGFRSVQPTKLRGLTLRLGMSNLFFIGIGPTTAYGPKSLEVGEVELYCSTSGTRVYLDKNGVVHVDAASGQDVIVNGGSAKVGRVGDSVDLGTFAFTPGSGAAALVWTPPGGGTPVTLAPAGTDLTGSISSGAAHFKG